MELLKGWIGPRIHQALTEVLDWKTQGSAATNDGRRVEFEDDGNSLRVKSSKPEYVQISKIEGFSTPVQLWLSDTKTLLKVIVSAAAAERFEDEYGRRVTEGTLGAVIQIHDYEIVAQHHGPKRTKITMLINNFKHVGSDGSPAFGNPCSIECQPPIIELLEKLQTLRAQEQPPSQSLASFKAARDHMGSPSLANSMSSADESHDRSQAIFATQIPRLQSKKRLREGSVKSNEYPPSALDESDSARSLDIVKGGDGSDRALEAKSPSTHGGQEPDLSHDGRASSNSMDIQHKANGQNDGEQRIQEQEEAEKLSRNQDEDILTKKRNQLLDLLNRDKAKPNQVKQLPVPILKASEQPKQDPPDPVTSPSTASRNASPDRQTNGTSSIPPSQSPHRVMKPAQRSSTPRDLDSSNKAGRRSPKLSTRITGRDIRISKSQKDLLDRSDSWYPPEPGHRTPSANIPILLLQELNSQAERQASSLRESLQPSSQSESSEAEENDKQSFQSEEPFPTEEWPASPPAQIVLPPDSSLNSARSSKSSLNGQSPEPEHHHDLNITTSIEEDHSPPKRRLSTNSLSSHSDMGARSYLPRAAKTNSSRSSHHSSKATTPLQRRSPAPPRNATKINASPAMNLPGLVQQKTGHDNSHDVSDQSGSHFQGYSINPVNVNEMPDADHPKYFRPNMVDTEHPLSSIPRSEIQARSITSSVNSRRNSKGSSPINNSQKAHQIPTQELSETSNFSSNQNGKLQSKPPDIGLSDSESSIETSFPYGLDKTNDISSTVPFTQLSRTPYLSKDSAGSPLSSTSPTGANKGASHQFRSSTAEVRKSHLSKATNDVYRANGILNTYGAGNNQELRESESMGHACYPKPRADQASFVGQTNSSAAHQPVTMIEETVLPLGTLPDASGITESILQPKIGVNDNIDQKRKASELVLSPNVTKRRKAAKLDRVMSDLGITERKVDPEDIGRQHRLEFFANRKSLTGQSSDNGNDATDILDSPKSASTGLPQIINDILPEKPAGSITRENPNPPDNTLNDVQSEGSGTALNIGPVVLAPQVDVQAQDVPLEAQTDNPDHKDPKESDVGSVRQVEVVPNVIPSIEVSATGPLLKTPDSVFDRFLMTYPDYPGNSVQFAAICSRICSLFQEDRMEHPSLWDDFIVRHRTDYPKYMSQCADEAVDPMPFERYYRSKILQAKYVSPNGPVVTPINIHEFQPYEPKPKTSTASESSIRKLHKNDASTTSESSIGKIPKHNTSTTSESRIVEITPSATSNRKETERRSIEVIELSDQEEVSRPVKKAKSIGSPKSKQVRRSLPWKSSDQVPNGGPPGIKNAVSTPTARVAEQQSSATTTRFKNARSQNIIPISSSAGKASARIEKTSNPSSQSRPRNGAASATAPKTIHPTPKILNSTAKPVQRSDEINMAKDPHSPYNTWARNYQSITAGKGNSYAQGNASQPKPKDKKSKAKPIDPFMFEL
ncbi:MAG: hypothetical protein Q9195_003058 [Heterodermia aff. obscurata]